MALLKNANKAKPDLPSWDDKANNVEEWKKKSAMREGFELALSFFTPK